MNSGLSFSASESILGDVSLASPDEVGSEDGRGGRGRPLVEEGAETPPVDDGGEICGEEMIDACRRLKESSRSSIVGAKGRRCGAKGTKTSSSIGVVGKGFIERRLAA